MKKRLLAVALLATICLYGCNSDDSSTSDEPKSETVTETDSEEGSPTENEGETAPDSETDIVTPVETSRAIRIDFESELHCSTNGPFLWSVDYEYPVLDDPRYPELSLAIQDYRMNYVRNMEASKDELAALAEQDYSEFGAEYWPGYYCISESMTVKRADATAVSIVEQGYLYQGGAHGSDGYACFNVDTKTGDRIALDDVITDMDLLPQIIATEMLELYPDIAYWTPTLAETFEAYINPEITLSWTLDYNGVTFYFGSYEVGSYADGRQQVTVLYSEYQPIFNEYYFENVTDDYVIPASAWNSLDVDLDADRDPDHIYAALNYTGAYEGFSSFTIKMNNMEYTQDAYGWVFELYYVRANGKSYLYATVLSDSDYAETFVYEISGSGISYKGSFNGGTKYFTNSSDFCVTKHFHMLSTLVGTTACYVGENGLPVEKNGVYDVSQMEYTLISTKEITADLVDANGKPTGESHTFPAGSEFTYLRTDGKTYVDMLSSDGKQCRFYTGNDEWPATINGMDATECFETLFGA